MRLYRSINELPMYAFIRCMCDGRLKSLIIEGEADEDTLQAVWADILAEYSQEIGSHEHKLYLNLFKEAGVLAADIRDIHRIVSILGIVYSARLAAELNVLVEANFQFDPSDVKEYQRLLQACLDRSQSKKIDLQIKEQQLEEIHKKTNNPSKAPTAKYFNTVLITLSDYAKFNVSDEITVFEYCERVRRLNKYLESLKRVR
ncbi:MAG: hypothetical protein Q8943_17445 [Bacteroidota bacterium]|nr:hypothetical protein [Bacteroidota bacterium]